MNFKQLTSMLSLLREGEELEKIGGAVGEVGRALKGGAKAIFQGAAELGAKAGDKGYKGVGALIKYAPHAAVVGGGVAAAKSQTGQKLRWKLREMKAKRDMRKAGYY